MEKTIVEIETTYRDGKKIKIIHYSDGTRKVTLVDPLHR